MLVKRYFLLLTLTLLFLLSGCTPKYDYTVHKPKIVYKKPTRKALKKTLQNELGKDYVWAEEGPDAFDCSGLVYYSYGRMNMPVPRVSKEQAKIGKEVSVENLQYGDLMFFDTSSSKKGAITHVGIYIGNGKFQHASSSKEGVITTPIDSNYYKDRLIICRRYLRDDPNAPKVMPKPIYTQPFEVAKRKQTISKEELLAVEEETGSFQKPIKTAKEPDHTTQYESGMF